MIDEKYRVCPPEEKNHQKIQINSFMFCDVSQIMHTAEVKMEFYVYRTIKLT